VCFRDLYDLMDWHLECPQDEMLDLRDGFYQVTVCSNLLASRCLGDEQEIDFYLQPLVAFPSLAREGVPTLCE